VVSNDTSNAGVDWSLTCANTGNCGTLFPLHTNSGDAAMYTPPGIIAGNSQTVNIVAFATADHTKNVATPLSVNAFGSSLQGTYVLQTVGTDVAGPYQFAGVVVLDGNGIVTSGEQTINTVDPNTSVLTSFSDVITGGNYFVGPDGRGTLTINTANQSIGQLGIEIFSLVFLNNKQALIAKLDDPNLQPPSFETSQGTMDLQTSVTTPTGGYAFVVSGTDIASLAPTAMGGVMNIDSPNTISGAGSISDQDLGGGLYPNAGLSGTVSTPDAFGAVTFNLTTDYAPSIQLKGYIVDATHIKLIESDNNSGTGFGSTAGIAIGQGTAAGTFTTNASFSGMHVYGLLGQDFSFLPTSLASVGIFDADGNGHLIRGVNDEFFGGLFLQVRDQFHATYTVDPNGTGRVDSFLTYPLSGFGPEYIFYLTGNGNPPLILDVDANALGGGGVATGIAYPAIVPSPFNGTYGLSFTQSSFGSEGDSTGQITVDGTANTLTGVLDGSSFFTPVPNTPLSGTFNPVTSSGRSKGGLSNQLFPVDPISVEFYFIDSGHGFFIENDSYAVTGTLTFGYFAARTPVCQGCP